MPPLRRQQRSWRDLGGFFLLPGPGRNECGDGERGRARRDSCWAVRAPVAPQAPGGLHMWPGPQLSALGTHRTHFQRKQESGAVCKDQGTDDLRAVGQPEALGHTGSSCTLCLSREAFSVPGLCQDSCKSHLLGGQERSGGQAACVTPVLGELGALVCSPGEGRNGMASHGTGPAHRPQEASGGLGVH